MSALPGLSYRHALADLLDRAAKHVRPRAPRCPHCCSGETRLNRASSAKGAMICDACGARWTVGR